VREPNLSKRPCVLAIGGLDPGGGAGLAADLRAIAATGAFGCPVATLVTIQSTAGLRAIHVLPASWVVRQAEEVRAVQRVRAIKIGALGSAANVRHVAAWLEGPAAGIPVVLDPVMVPTRGRPGLLVPSAVAAVRDLLLPRATLVTANAPEAEALTGEPVTTVSEARDAARRLVRLGAHAALVKGGHLGAERVVVDILASRRAPTELRAPRTTGDVLHGGGCVLASLIAGHVANRRGALTERGLIEAVRSAHRLHQRARHEAVDVGGPMRVLVP
jgi:hydroxymethylpyrimidine/phosphomethylpyrimidine kinase